MSSPDTGGPAPPKHSTAAAPLPPSPPPLRLVLYVATGVVAVAAAFFVTNAVAQALLLNVGVGLGLMGLEIVKVITRRHVVVGLAVFLAMTISFLAGRYLRWSANSPEFPARAGVGSIADFTLGAGGPARNAFGLQFSMFSDSTWNLESKIWFSRVSDPDVSGNGYLRVFYQLVPMTDHEPYVGVYTDFSLPPPTVLDISRFRKLTMRMRLGQSLTESPVHVSAVLYSANMHDPDYIFPTFEVPDAMLKSEWQTIGMPLDDFRNPSISASQVVLDKQQVYRVALLIRGLPTRGAFGHLDVDDIRFE